MFSTAILSTDSKFSEEKKKKKKDGIDVKMKNFKCMNLRAIKDKLH